MFSLGRRVKNLAIAVDQLAWVLVTLGHGAPDETMSAAAWRLDLDGRWQGRVMRPLIDGFFFLLTLGFDDDHCRDSYESERQRRQLHPHYRASP